MIWTVVLMAKVGEVLMLVETGVDDTVDAVQVGWYRVVAAGAQIE